jgi:glyoxalase family protein
MELTGLHHVTAVTARAADNLRYYTETLGLRLVKKTVNQDDVSAYHLFYADAEGRPGTEVTFFDWADSPPNRAGTREIARIGLQVANRDALRWWQAKLGGEITEVSGHETLAFTDPEGQRLALVDGGRNSDNSAILGLGPITLVVEEADPTAELLTNLMGFRVTTREGQLLVFRSAAAEVHVIERPDLRAARQGFGGVHHVAFRTPNAEEQLAWQSKLHTAGVPTSGVIDRYYFKSLYFREPNGILFEIATDGPGFAIDESPATLGQRLSLPPFLESRRATIEAGLRPLAVPQGSD